MSDFREQEVNAVIGQDSRGLDLTHYVLAERIIQDDIRLMLKAHAVGDYDFISTRFGEGHRGYHNMTGGDLWSEWGDIEETWYGAYEDDELPYPPVEEDPIHRLEEDENGEVATYGQRLAETGAE